MQWSALLTPELTRQLELHRVGEVMAAQNISIKGTASIRDALQQLSNLRPPILAVVDNDLEQRQMPLGIVSLAGLTQLVVGKQHGADEQLSTIGAIRKVADFVHPEMSLNEAISLMERSGCDELLVCGPASELVGLLAESHVLDWLQQISARTDGFANGQLSESKVSRSPEIDAIDTSTSPRTGASSLSGERDLPDTLTTYLPGIMAYRCQSNRLWDMKYVSVGCIELTGYPPQDLLSQQHSAYSHIVHPRDLEDAREAATQAIANRRAFQISYRIMTASGQQRWVREKGRCIKVNNRDILEGFIDDISDLQEAKDALARRVERERAIGTIAQHIRQSLELEQSLKVAVSDLRHLLQVDRVAICRIETGERCIAIAESVAPEWPSMLGHDLMSTCTSLASCVPTSTRDAIPAIADIDCANIPACYVESLARFSVRAHAVVPIWQGGKLWGLLVAQHCTTPRIWHNSDLDLLRQLSIPIEFAIQQGQLYRRVQQLNADLERQVQQRTAELRLAFDFESTLQRIADRVRDSLDVNQIANTAVRELALCLGVICCNAALYDRDRGTSTIYFEYAVGVPSQRRVSQMEDFPELHYQLLKGHYFQFCSLLSNPLRGRSAMLACPIVDDRDVLGALWLVRSEQRTFSDQDIRLVLQVANHCAIAIRQARLYQAAEAQVRELERLNGLKDDFVSTVSHELRTPITSIRLAIQMLGIHLDRELDLAAELAKPPAKHNPTARYFRILQQECDREIKLIDNLLDFQRLEDNRNPPVAEPIDIANWLPRVVAPFCDCASNRQQTLTIECSQSLPKFTSDPSYLERILSELLANACKYTPAGERIAAIAFLEGNSMHLKITNTGILIPPDELPHIFEKFYRIPTNDPWLQGGTGLGLALVHKLVHHLGGEVSVESTPELTQFDVVLPLELPITLPPSFG
ncbi:MAG: GAF domain-containing protein [Cyanobacteria bacterium P01_F01_bin.33]